MLKDYNPWGKPGGGAPKPETDQKLCGLNPDVNRNHDESNPAYVVSKHLLYSQQVQFYCF